jgi:hypothetical protein
VSVVDRLSQPSACYGRNASAHRCVWVRAVCYLGTVVLVCGLLHNGGVFDWSTYRLLADENRGRGVLVERAVCVSFGSGCQPSACYEKFW